MQFPPEKQITCHDRLTLLQLVLIKSNLRKKNKKKLMVLLEQNFLYDLSYKAPLTRFPQLYCLMISHLMPLQWAELQQ